MSTITRDLFDGAFFQNPYPAWAELREAAPVHRHERKEDGPVWLISRYADVRAALADPRFSRDRRWALPPEERASAPGPALQMMVLMDPPEHTRLRKLVSLSFTTRRMQALRPRVQQLAGELIAALPESGEVDIMEAYAAPLPVFVICELLGVPPEDRHDFSRWSSMMVDDSGHTGTREAAGQLHQYLSGLIEGKRTNPDDALISALMTEVDDDKLSGQELIDMSMMLLIAGHETTVNLISNGLLALLTHPVQRDRLRADPELMPTAVEEFLRWDSPIQTATFLFTSEDVEIGGVTIPGGSEVKICLGAANRDSDRFPGGENLVADGSAAEHSPSGHLAFSHGLHHCLGAQLARIEGREAIQAIIAARPDMQLAVEPSELVYRRSVVARGLTTLPVRLDS